MDSDDLLLNTIKLFRLNPDIKSQYNKMYRYILLDDFQDFINSELMLEILKLLAGEECTVFCTGDDDQNIYEWMSSNGSQSSRLDTYYENFAVFNLTKSFRLPQEIISPALNLIKNNKKRIEKVFWTQKKPGKGLFEIKETLNPVEEATTVGRIIKDSVFFDAGKWKNFAVLARFKRQLKIYYEVFLKMHIPLSLVEQESFFTSGEIELLIKFLNAVVNYKLGPELKDVIEKSCLSQKDSREIIRELNRRKNSLTTLSTFKLGIEKLGLTSKSDEDVISFFELVEDFENIAENKTPYAFLNYLQIYKDTGLKKKAEKVKLLTIHKAKGLEFPNVFIIGLVEGMFPRIRPEAPELSLEEERRICYVGMTRATERLYLTYPKYRSSSRKQLNRTSRYVKEIVGV